MILAFKRYVKHEITREEFDEAREKIHIAINGAPVGELNFDGVSGEPGKSGVPTQAALDCLAECYRAEGRSFLVLSMPEGNYDARVSARFGRTDDEDAVAMIAAFLEGKPAIKEQLLVHYGREAMDLHVEAEFFRQRRERELDREIEGLEEIRTVPYTWVADETTPAFPTIRRWRLI
jgi:hypothetical protein